MIMDRGWLLSQARAHARRSGLSLRPRAHTEDRRRATAVTETRTSYVPPRLLRQTFLRYKVPHTHLQLYAAAVAHTPHAYANKAIPS
jgi:hypothetical protein